MISRKFGAQFQYFTSNFKKIDALLELNKPNNLDASSSKTKLAHVLVKPMNVFGPKPRLHVQHRYLNVKLVIGSLSNVIIIVF